MVSAGQLGFDSNLFLHINSMIESMNALNMSDALSEATTWVLLTTWRLIFVVHSRRFLLPKSTNIQFD